jgi:hypothetical protein
VQLGHLAYIGMTLRDAYRKLSEIGWTELLRTVDEDLNAEVGSRSIFVYSMQILHHSSGGLFKLQ